MAKIDTESGPVWLGLAQVARANGDKKQTLELFHRSLSKKWLPGEESDRRRAQLQYADLLSDAGRRNEAIALLMSIIEQRGDDPDMAKKAAETIRTIGSPAQKEEAYSSLANHFPADASVWLRLGDVRFAADQDVPALNAFQRAIEVANGNLEAQRAIGLRCNQRRGVWINSGTRESEAVTEKASGQSRNLGSKNGCGTLCLASCRTRMQG